MRPVTPRRYRLTFEHYNINPDNGGEASRVQVFVVSACRDVVTVHWWPGTACSAGKHDSTPRPPSTRVIIIDRNQ
ncbi:hypothetical protein E2C01_081655 [Portunus trituberculatus]|uniref:Uncharacterized protein n=1 Tax=Portunus trituberculatus TaxID=210409 RepID=A0A5B7IX55_PORTR|nr:hypothetical protein [Portunus trituberculatus]